ncbi:MAG: DUF4836 family protein [Prevotella sp.]|nr:DUF4836 family protein [Prevotella sp.]
MRNDAVHTSRYILLTICCAVCIVFLCSCGSDYRSAIPYGCKAMMRVDVTDETVGKKLSALEDMLKIDTPEESGIDLGESIYFFESVDGNLGLCAKVSDEDRLCDILLKNKAEQGPKRQGCQFFVLNGNIVVGCTSSSVLAMGPVMPVAQGEMYNRMTRFLLQDEEKSMIVSPMMNKLESMDGGMAIAAQADALPEKFAGVFAFGLPKGMELSQCIVAANVRFSEDMLLIDAEPMSFNANVDKALKASYDIFRPVTQKYLHAMETTSLVGLFANIEGNKFLPLLQRSESLQTLLMGINQTIDFNAVMKSIDGDIFLTVPTYGAERMDIAMAAQLRDRNFLDDIGYWKESVPAGARITDWRKDAYCYSDDTMTFCFGVTQEEKSQFYSGTSSALAEHSIQRAGHPLPEYVMKSVAGKRLALVVNIPSVIAGEDAVAMAKFLGMGNVRTIVYTVK